MSNAVESATKDLRDFLAANPTPDPKLVALLTGVIERAGVATAPADKGFIPPTVNSAPERSTAAFLSAAHAGEWSRRGQLEAADILAKPAWSREQHDKERAQAIKSLQLGGEGGSKINGDRS